MLPFETWLNAQGLSALKLSVTAALVATMYRNLEFTVKGLLRRKTPRDIIWGIAVVSVTMMCIPLILPSDTWAQHGITLWFLFLLLHQFIAARFVPEVLAAIYGEGQPCWHRNIARWTIVSYAAQAVLNETYIQYATSQIEWVTAFAMTPIFIYYVKQWTIAATSQDEDFDR